jgi:hypothetical protein
VPSSTRVRWRNVTFRPGYSAIAASNAPCALGKQRVHMLVILGPQLDAVDETFALVEEGHHEYIMRTLGLVRQDDRAVA